MNHLNYHLESIRTVKFKAKKKTNQIKLNWSEGTYLPGEKKRRK